MASNINDGRSGLPASTMGGKPFAIKQLIKRSAAPSSMSSRLTFLLIGLLALATACSHQPSAVSAKDTGTPTQMPSFVPHSNESDGISPTHALVDTIIPLGTEIVVRLQSTLLSDNLHAGDRFAAILDKPIAVRGEVLAPRGAKVEGRVVSVHTANTNIPAFLQLTLCSVEITGKSVSLHTSAVFAKGALPSPNSVANAGVAIGVADSDPVDSLARRSREVEFSTGRKLTFWLVQASTL